MSHKVHRSFGGLRAGLAALFVSIWAEVGGVGVASKMREFAIELPNHRLHFALPEEMAREMSTKQVQRSFDPSEPNYRKTGIDTLVAHIHDIRGPGRVGALGSLNLNISVYRKFPEYPDTVATVGDLKSYWEWLAAGKYSATGFKLDQGLFADTPWVRRWFHRAGSVRSGSKFSANEAVAFSHPLDHENYLDVNFGFWEWKSGNAGNWRDRAHAMSVAIMESVRLEPRPRTVSSP